MNAQPIQLPYRMHDENDCMLCVMSNVPTGYNDWIGGTSQLTVIISQPASAPSQNRRLNNIGPLSLLITHYVQHLQNLPRDRRAPKHIHLAWQVTVILFTGEEVFGECEDKVFWAMVAKDLQA